MPLPVQNADASSALQRTFSTVGRLRLQLDQVVVPVAIVADLSANGTLPVSRRACAAASAPAVANESAYFRFETPAGVFAVIESVTLRGAASSSSGEGRFGSTLAAPASLGDKQFMDGRLREAGVSPACNLGFDTLAVTIADPTFRWLLNGGVADIDATITALAGAVVGRQNAVDFIEVTSATQNSAVIASWVWTEFLAAP